METQIVGELKSYYLQASPYENFVVTLWQLSDSLHSKPFSEKMNFNWWLFEAGTYVDVMKKAYVTASEFEFDYLSDAKGIMTSHGFIEWVRSSMNNAMNNSGRIPELSEIEILKCSFNADCVPILREISRIKKFELKCHPSYQSLVLKQPQMRSLYEIYKFSKRLKKIHSLDILTPKFTINPIDAKNYLLDAPFDHLPELKSAIQKAQI